MAKLMMPGLVGLASKGNRIRCCIAMSVNVRYENKGNEDLTYWNSSRISVCRDQLKYKLGTTKGSNKGM